MFHILPKSFSLPSLYIYLNFVNANILKYPFLYGEADKISRFPSATDAVRGMTGTYTQFSSLTGQAVSFASCWLNSMKGGRDEWGDFKNLLHFLVPCGD